MKTILSAKSFLRRKLPIHELSFINFNYRVCGFRAILMRDSWILGIENFHITNERKEKEYIIMNFENNKRNLIQGNES